MRHRAMQLILAGLAIALTLGCAGSPLLSVPVGLAETQDQRVTAIHAPATARRGVPVPVILTLWHPGEKCWRHERMETSISYSEMRVRFKPIMRFLPTLEDVAFGRGCLVGTEDMKVVLTLEKAGQYLLEAPFLGNAIPAVVPLEVVD